MEFGGNLRANEAVRDWSRIEMSPLTAMPPMRSTTIAVVLLLLLTSLDAAAEAGWTEPAKIVSLESNIFGRTLVELDLRKNPSNCKEKALFFRETTGASSEQMLTVLLEAAAHGLRVKLRVSGSCHLKGYAEYNAVALVP